MTFSTVSKKTGKTYYLHKISVVRGDGFKDIYFFQSTDSEHGLTSLPDGFEIIECRNGLPVLRRIK